MYTKNRLIQFADWMEENLEIDDDEKQRIAVGISSGLVKNKIDFSNLCTDSLIQLFRVKIKLVGYCNLGLCKKEDEAVVFAGLEKYRKIYEISLKSALKDGNKDEKEERVSGVW